MKITKLELTKIIQEELQIALLSEGLRHHIDTATPLTKNIYRVGSDAYFNIISEARVAYKKGIYTPLNEEEKEMLNSDLGEVHSNGPFFKAFNQFPRIQILQCGKRKISSRASKTRTRL